MTSDTITLSIVIPTLNEETSLPRLLAQLHSKKSNTTEIIVVDGGSTDQTLTNIVETADLIIKSQPGRAEQMNAGAARAKGRCLWFLHADSKVDFDFETIITSSLGQHTWGWFDIRIDHRQKIFRMIEFMMNTRSRLTSVATGDQGLFMLKDIFVQSEGFPKIALMEDVAFAKKLRKLSKPFVSQHRVRTSARHWIENGPIQTIVKMWILRLLFCLKVSPVWLEKLYYKK